MRIAGRWVKDVIHLRKCRQCGHWSDWWQWKFDHICRTCSLNNMVATIHAMVGEEEGGE